METAKIKKDNKAKFGNKDIIMNLNIFQFIVLQAVVLWYRQKKFYAGVVVDLKLQ